MLLGVVPSPSGELDKNHHLFPGHGAAGGADYGLAEKA